MRIGSAFSGIGGLELGLEASIPNARTVWQIEVNSYARKVLEKNFPEADRSVSDICNATASSLESVDLICAGFPCQGISVAGKRRGLEDSRSGLWFELLRLCGEIKPTYIVLENSPAIRTAGLKTVLSGLASLGYDALWGTFSASSVGAPHRRNRWFCVAFLPDPDSFSIRKQHLYVQRRHKRKSAAVTSNASEKRPAANPYSNRKLQQKRRISDQRRRARNSHGWTTKPGVCGVAYGIPHGMDRNRALGNAVVPEWARWVGSIVSEMERI